MGRSSWCAGITIPLLAFACSSSSHPGQLPGEGLDGSTRDTGSPGDGGPTGNAGDSTVTDAGAGEASAETAANPEAATDANEESSGNPPGDGNPNVNYGPPDDVVQAPPPPPPTPQSCMTPGPGVSDCTPDGGSCCANYALPAGSYYRSYDGVSHTTQSFPAAVASVQLDQYEITVGRLRRFVTAVVSGWMPAPASGKHTHLAAGQGLAVSGMSGSYESGWDSTWNASLATTASAWDTNLACDRGSGDATSPAASWTPTAGANERLPANCMTWYEAYAFCIWDGGFLPSEAEWNYAASGGNEQRVYPWSNPASSTTIDCTHANYYGANMGTDDCVMPGVGAVNAVGSESPQGDSKWGQADLGGNVFEWALDAYAAYQTPCSNCAYLQSAAARVIRGGGFGNSASFLYASWRGSDGPTSRTPSLGARCARVP